ncbi:hypothetical protein GCM10010174_89430 [Kutzneria viridogrisea]|uniref:Uncharacterized protein n=1 Tax=Kutzneria viridogrisea TaxID=47990 RepID=A0ABR6BR68_9PSEU|nr:hypothetical protein [Kutzneria viridogrisea]
MRPLGSAKARWATAGIVAVVALSGLAFVLFGTGSDEQPVTSANATVTSTSASEAPTTTPSVSPSNAHVTTPSGTVSGTPGTAPPALVNWLQGGGLQQTSGLLADSSQVLAGRSNSGGPNLANACESLAKNVRAAKAYQPIPDETTQRAWAGALAGFDHGAAECVTGTKANNAGQISSATKEIGTSSEALKQVMTRLSDLAR